MLLKQLEPVRTGHDPADQHDKDDHQDHPAAAARAGAPAKSESMLEKIVHHVDDR